MYCSSEAGISGREDVCCVTTGYLFLELVEVQSWVPRRPVRHRIVEGKQISVDEAEHGGR